MTTEPPDPFETELQNLFAAAHPAAGFEDRLVHAVRRQRRLRLTIPIPIRKAAIAAAAVLAVGSVGYYGNLAMTGKLRFAANDNLYQSASAPTTQAGLIVRSKTDYAFKDGLHSGHAFDQSRNLDWESNPFIGTQHDNIFPTERRLNSLVDRNGVTPSSTNSGKIIDSDDSILLPNAKSQKEKRGQSPFATPSNTFYQVQPNIPEAKKAAASAETSFREDRGKTIAGLVLDARQYTDEGKYTEAVAVINNIRQLDPNNKYANDAGQFLEDRAANQNQRKYSENNDREYTKVLNDRKDAPSPSPTGGKVNAFAADILPETNKEGQSTLSSAPTSQPTDDRKIIRTGEMEFEVDRFDTAQIQITKIVNELGGFVGATDSQKLPNGKVRGSISVRVPPERLDTLVLSLRALGDLKSQQITAADITKEYTDLQSELTADRAMQDRLLELIHNGKGSVKDLLAAENELGTWRTKIEKAEGMIRYYNGQVALSTLNITLSERDIQTPATAVQTETADIGIEADDVEKARNIALKAIDDAKGRVVEAELKRFDAGQLAAKLVADVPPESGGTVIDQLKLLGKVARLEIQREQKNSDGSNVVTSGTPLHMETKPTRLLISIYNLANVAPRRTTNVSLAATDVEAAYTALATAAKTNGGRVVTSSLDRGDPVKATGSLVLEFPPDKFGSAMIALHAQGDVLKLALVENTDTQNSTEAKQGLTVQLVSLASVPARESVQQTLAAPDVPTAYQAVLNAINTAHARVQSATLNEQDRQNVTADLQLELPRSAEADFDKALSSAGGTIARTSTRAAEAEGTVDSKVQLHLSITSSDHLAPRETTKLQIETADVDKSAGDIQAAALAAGGRVLEATISKDHGKGLARIILDLPLDKSNDVLQQIRNEGTVRGIDASRDPQAPAGPLAHAQIFVEFTTTEAIIADQTGPWASIRQGLSTSVAGLLWSLQWVIVGACLILPWLAIGWVGWKVKVRMTKSRITKQ